MRGFLLASALTAALLTSPAAARVSGEAEPLRPNCLRLSAPGESPVRRSGRITRTVTYAIVHTLELEGAVNHPPFFANRRRGATSACTGVAGRG